MDFALVVKQLCAEGLGEAQHCVLGRALGRLQGNASIFESGANLYDHAPVAC